MEREKRRETKREVKEGTEDDQINLINRGAATLGNYCLETADALCG